MAVHHFVLVTIAGKKFYRCERCGELLTEKGESTQ